MKKIVALLLLNASYNVSSGQVAVTPYIGMNSTRIYDGIAYHNGGAFGVMGAELELSLRGKERKALYLSVATGASYLNNGFYYSSNIAYTAVNLYIQRISDLKTRYLQVPITVRLNWQPFPLVEEWMVFLGLGACHNTLIEATLEEKYTEVMLNADILATPQVTNYQDRGNITAYGEKTSLFGRVELGMKYKRLQVSYRLSRSFTEMYRTGLEADWAVPDEESWYIDAYHDAGKIIEKHAELVVGFRFGRSR